MDGGEPLRLTSGKKDESTPRFSPNGEWIAFLSDREGKKAQVYLLSRRGGEAVKLTDYTADVSDLAWSPDSKRLALVVSDVDPDADGRGRRGRRRRTEKKKTPKPIVLRRLQFKRDGEGYLREVRKHVHVFDVEKKTSVQVTSGPFDDSEPAWSPDGQSIAFVSNRTLPDPDRSQDADVFVVAAREGQVPRARARRARGRTAPPPSAPTGGGSPTWPAATRRTSGTGRATWRSRPVAGGPARPLTAALDRNVTSPRFTPDGRAVLFLLEDRGNRHLARVPVEGGSVERVVERRARRPGVRRGAQRRDRRARDLGPPAPGDLGGRRERPAPPHPRERRRS